MEEQNERAYPHFPRKSLPDEQIYKIGYALITWNEIEFELDAIYMLTMGKKMSSEEAARVMDRASRTERMMAVERQVEHELNHSRLYDYFRESLGRYESLKAFQSDIANGRWEDDDGRVTVRTISREKHVDLADFDRIIFEIIELSDHVGRLRAAIQFWASLRNSPLKSMTENEFNQTIDGILTRDGVDPTS